MADYLTTRKSFQRLSRSRQSLLELGPPWARVTTSTNAEPGQAIRADHVLPRALSGAQQRLLNSISELMLAARSMEPGPLTRDDVPAFPDTQGSFAVTWTNAMRQISLPLLTHA